MGSRKTPGSKDLSPFTHTSPGEPAVPHVITADNSVRGEGEGGSSVSVLQGEFVIPSSLKNDRSLLFSFFHSSTAMTPFRACLGQDMMDSFFFFFCLVNSAFTPHMVYIVHPPPGELCDNLQWLYLNVALMGALSWFLLYHMQTMVENN